MGLKKLKKKLKKIVKKVQKVAKTVADPFGTWSGDKLGKEKGYIEGGIRGVERAVGGGGVGTEKERAARAAQLAAMTEQERLDAELKEKENAALREAATLQSAFIYALRRQQPRGGTILTSSQGLQQSAPPDLAYRTILGQ